MIGRITSQMTAQTLLSNINDAFDRITTTQQQLSSGKRISQPSDDPYGTSLTLQLHGQLSNLSSYQSNVDDGTGWAQSSGTALSSITGAVQRVRELVVRSANGSLSSADLQATAAEVNQLIDSIKQDANTQYNGQYVFSGSATTTAPYQAGTNDAYAGNRGQVTREIGPNTPLAVNGNLAAVLGTGQTVAHAPAGDGLLLNTLRNISDDLQSGNTSALAGTDLTKLDSNMNSLIGLQATVGSVQDRLQVAASRITSLQSSATQALSSTEDVDMAQASIDFSTEQAALQAALQSGAHIVQQSLMNFLNG